jgi:ubiquinone/menaquinone biosynthesis C-methylase UbiE
VIDAQRFARLVTDAVVRRPAAWRLLRRPLRGMFDGLAPTWGTRIGPHHLWALDLALEDVPPPVGILDLGTGTGVVAKALAERYPEADVTGIDLSPGMIEEAVRQLPPELSGGRVSFEVGDAAALDCSDAAFELVVLSNMIPFFDELARVTAPGGMLVLSFSRGDETPIYVPFERLRDELACRGFAEFAEFSAEPATAFRAQRR